MAQTYHNSKPKLKLLVTPKSDLRLAGVAPTDEMKADRYLVANETAWIEPLGKGHRAVFQFRVVDGKFDGTALRMWVMVADAGGVISPTGRYARYCAIALGRPLEGDDPVNEPSQIFAGRFFLVEVGFRKTERAKGGKCSDAFAQYKKDSADYLRVHGIVELVEL